MYSAVITFSVIIPTHNRCASLHRLLESIADARIPPATEVEVLVVDNGSEDGTATMLAAQAGRLSNVCFTTLAEVRKGKASALNRGLAAARGDFILVLDDDVTVDADLFLRQLEAYQIQSFDAVQGRVLPGLDAQGNPADPARLREYNIPLIDYGDDFREIRGLTGTNMSFKRQVFETIGGFDPRLGPGAAGFSEDTEYSRRIRKAGFKIGYTPYAVVRHELDPGRYGRAYNRTVEYRKGLSRSIYRNDSIAFRVLPDLIAHCLRFVLYYLLGKRQKIYRTEGRICKCWGYLSGKVRRASSSKPLSRRGIM
jgi:glycosyltransferase involved in cell wall biosynthesis